MKKRKVTIMVCLATVLSLSVVAVCMANTQKTDKGQRQAEKQIIEKRDKAWYQTEKQAAEGEVYEYQEKNNDTCKIVTDLYEEDQIKKEELLVMSTEKLVDACLCYPLFGMIYASNESEKAGFREIWNKFNGLQELEKREDAGRVLMEIYQQLDHREVAVSGDDFYLMRMKYLEMILSDNRILNKLSKHERSELSACARRYIEIRKEEFADPFIKGTTIQLVAAIAELDDKDYIKFAEEHKSTARFLTGDLLAVSNEEEYEQALEILGIR